MMRWRSRKGVGGGMWRSNLIFDDDFILLHKITAHTTKNGDRGLSIGENDEEEKKENRKK